MTPKIERFLADRPPTPCLVVDLDVVRDRYRTLKRELPVADVYYAVKANPARPVLDLLVGLGSCFDAASLQEVDACLASGAKPRAISYGNTVKKESDIAGAFAQGVDLYAFDSAEELDKLARAAPGARVYCRIITSNGGAQWPLSRKFGCDLDMARDLMIRARTLGLDAYGLSFHVGSQQTDPMQWDVAIGRAAMVFSDLRHHGIEIKMLNLGGGFPAHYREDIPEFDSFAETIMKAMTRHFGNALPEMIIEPGRSVVGDAGVLESEVVLVAKRGYKDASRWVYLDVGKFGGLAETMDEAIQYRIRAAGVGGRSSRVVIAGPTCDSVDTLYEKAGYRLPDALKAGDRLRLMSAGAYTTTYASIGFNGFAPLREHYI
ncbi:MAG: type III PLP-dependent enzyme [Alphaproteobacteria bacterium]|nr:type III PLP-dependent enzyme [Alphaproteobacteria bacterium]